MISHALNHEDVLLARVFQNVERGFYVDVGAYHPTEESVTKHFYDLGWTGINIEPASSFYSFLGVRVRDINLNLAISDRDGEARFEESSERPCWSRIAVTGNPDIWEEGESSEKIVATRTLASVLEEYAPEKTIDFLKIDVEGHEPLVVQGNDWNRFRPRVLVIETLAPGYSGSTHEKWEPLLLSMRYHFAMFDGVNRYYVRDEDRDLLSHFDRPINTLDNYIPIRFVEVCKNLTDLQLRLSEVENANSCLQDEVERYCRLLSGTGKKSLHIGLGIARTLNHLERIMTINHAGENKF